MRKLFQLVGEITLHGVEGADKKIKKIDREANKLSRSILKLGKSFKKTGAAMTKNLTVPILALGAAVTKVGADFDKAMTKSLAIMGDISGPMRKRMEVAARSVAKTTEASAAQAAEAYFFLASAGMDALQSIAALPLVAKFAQAGQFDLAKATDLLTDAQSALGLSSKDAAENLHNMTRVSDVLVKANTLANASVEQFSEALTNKAGAALRILGKSIEEGAAVLAVYADQGVKASEAGSALNIVFRDLQKAAIKNKRAFVSASISVFDSSGEMRNMADIVKDLENRFAGMSDEQLRSELLMLGFTDKSISATISLIGTSDAIREYETRLKSAGGITERVSKAQLKNFWSQLNLLQSKLMDVALVLWKDLFPIMRDSVIPTIESLILKLATLSQWFTGLSPRVKKMTIAALALLAALGPLLFVIGSIIGALKILGPLIGVIKIAMLGLNAAILANPFALAAVAIGIFAAAITGAVLAYKDLQREHEKWSVLTAEQTAINSFTAAFDNLTAKMKDNAAALGTVEQAQAFLGADLEKLTEQARELGFTVEGDLQQKLSRLNEISNSLKGTVVELGKGFVQASKDAQKSAENEKEAGDKKKKLTIEEIQQLAKLAKDRARFEENWTQKVLKETANREAALEIEKQLALKKADKLGADRNAVIEFYFEKENQLRDEMAQKETVANEERRNKREQFETEWNAIFAEKSFTRVEILEAEKQLVLQKAEELGAEKHAILEFYAEKERELSLDTAKQFVRQFTAAINQANRISSQHTNNEIALIDKRLKSQTQAITDSGIAEEQKQTQIEALEAEADKKKLALQRKQARRDKRAAIFNAIINTAQAISKALTLGFPLGLIMAAIFGGLGLAQIAVIASKPLPFKEGGLVRGGRGGVTGQIGEGKEDEIVLPLKTGVRALADALMEKLAAIEIPDFGIRAPARAGRSTETEFAGERTPGNTVENHWHVGTLIADDRGMKELNRRMRTFEIAETQRLGAA